jgi:hypothetical protein
MRLVAIQATAGGRVGMGAIQAGFDFGVAREAKLLGWQPEQALLAGVVRAMASAALSLAFEPVRRSFLGSSATGFMADHAQCPTATLMKEVHVGIAMGLMAPLTISVL